ncbi:MAG TPA: hypothetical protein VKG23_17510 [Thermoanaerobaculia bacterium]|nr:hypothetical protein [Thermoanaerobaculia bacterium]
MNETSTPQPATPPPAAAPAAAPPPAAAPYPVVVDRKSPALAGFLSFFPGLGHLYLGLYPRAFAVGGAFILGIMMTSHGGPGEFFGPLVAFVWFFGIIDAVRQAKAINRGQAVEAGFAGDQQLRRAAVGTGALTWGVILVGLGALLLIDRYFDIDWSFMSEWGGPAAFILLGLVLIVAHVRKRRQENDSQAGMPPRSS